MQTATMWLQEQIFNSDWKNMSGEDKLKLFEQAKEMEKQHTLNLVKHLFGSIYESSVEQYYAETYEKTNKK